MKDQTMKTEHTPGPWTIQHGHSSRVYLINNPQGHAVGEIVYSDTRNPADAQLIAAAPDLLAALMQATAALKWARDIIQDVPPKSQFSETIKESDEAIYKAMGA